MKYAHVEELAKKESLNSRNYFSDVKDDELTMFNASKKIKQFLNKQLEHLNLKEYPLSFYLVDDSSRHQFIQQMLEKGIVSAEMSSINKALKSLGINLIAFEKHKARNIYNFPYTSFIEIFKIDKKQQYDNVTK